MENSEVWHVRERSWLGTWQKKVNILPPITFRQLSKKGVKAKKRDYINNANL